MKTFEDPKKNIGCGCDSTKDEYRRDISEMEEAEMFDNGPSSPDERMSNNAVKGGAWLLGIVGVFAVAVLIAMFVGKHDSPLSVRSDTRQAYALADNGQKKGSGGTVYEYVEIVTSDDDVNGAGMMSANMELSGSGLVQPVKEKASAKVSESDQARIEREAMEVIHGDYGDNPVRQAKLGKDYAAVQARVNEILE